MKQKLILLIVFTLLLDYSYGQFIDRYGVNMGVSYSTQTWSNKLFSMDFRHDYKLGAMVFVSAEKDFSRFFALRTELGYIQKGFKNGLELILPNGDPAGVIENEDVILHDLALNLGVKVSPFSISFSPYLFIGGRADYMISYKDVVFIENGSGNRYNIFEGELDDLDPLNFGGLVGFGLDIRQLYYIEVEYNPTFTKSSEAPAIRIKDNCWGAKVGVNLNQLIRNKKAVRSSE